jgi:hypothetical protein
MTRKWKGNDANLSDENEVGLIGWMVRCSGFNLFVGDSWSAVAPPATHRITNRTPKIFRFPRLPPRRPRTVLHIIGWFLCLPLYLLAHRVPIRFFFFCPQINEVATLSTAAVTRRVNGWSTCRLTCVQFQFRFNLIRSKVERRLNSLGKVVFFVEFKVGTLRV